MTKEEKLQQMFDEDMRNPKTSAKMEAIRDYLNHLIYVEPKLYEVLVSLNISLTKKEENKFKEQGEKVFTVFTKLDHTTKRNLLSINVNKRTALAIKQLIKNKPQRMFCEVEGAPFNVVNSTLSLNNMTIDISRKSFRFQLCEILLADEEDLKRVWLIDEVLEIMGVQIEGEREKYNYLRNLVKPLNERIDKQLGYPNFIDLNYISVNINPIYVYSILGK